MSAEQPKQKFVDSSDRFEQKARDREAGMLEENKNVGRLEVIVPASQRGFVRARDTDIDLTQKLGKSVVISSNTPLSQQGGFFCDVCDCLVKDSANYLDHINGKKHQRAMGLSMRTERATVEEVRDHLASGKKRDISKTSTSNNEERDEYKEREERDKKDKKERQKEYKRLKKEEEEKQKQLEVDPDDVFAQMGLPTGFGGSKK